LGALVGLLLVIRDVNAPAFTMTPPPTVKVSRPVTLKLKTSSSFMNGTSITATPTAMSPPVATPSGKIIVLKRSQPPTPAGGVPILPATPSNVVTTTQKGRVSKPTAKKRAKDDVESDDEVPLAARPAAKRPKLVVKTPVGLGKVGRTASIVVKQSHKGEVPIHANGEGYDSEDDEKEIDPIVEEQFILRMLPGEYCEYLSKAIADRKIGVPLKEGGADISLRWLPNAERRAVLNVNGALFAGVLVDLPTITEGMKTWDRKNFMKSADICQMLLIFARVTKDDEARTISLPKMVGKDYRWPHGLTPPMHDCIHRRFRKRLSKKEIKDKEAELQRLLDEDKKAESVKFELVDDSRNQRSPDAESAIGEEEDEDEDAFGEMEDSGYFGPQHASSMPEPEIDDAALEAEFFDEEMDEAEPAETPAVPVGATPASAATATPAAQAEASPEASDADDDDDVDDDELDEDEQAEAEQVKAVREDIKDLLKQIETLEAQKQAQPNLLLRKRLDTTISKVKSELKLKQASIGEAEEE